MILQARHFRFEFHICGKYNQVVYARDFKTASRTTTPHQFMRPIKIKGDWMEVFLLDSDFKKVGEGWIQWKIGGNLQIKYNLLS